MRMGKEEQKEEREVLDSIFPDEITGIGSFALPKTKLTTLADVSDTEYRISINLDVTGEDGEEEDARKPLRLCFQLIH